METRRDVFQAIADPTRRDIIHLITHRSLTPNTLSQNFAVSRQAISRHLQILTECGLIRVTQQGRERYYQVRIEMLDEVTNWVEKQRQTWEARFSRIDKLLMDPKKKAKKKKQTT